MHAAYRGGCGAATVACGEDLAACRTSGAGVACGASAGVRTGLASGRPDIRHTIFLYKKTRFTLLLRSL